MVLLHSVENFWRDLLAAAASGGRIRTRDGQEMTVRNCDETSTPVLTGFTRSGRSARVALPARHGAFLRRGLLLGALADGRDRFLLLVPLLWLARRHHRSLECRQLRAGRETQLERVAGPGSVPWADNSPDYFVVADLLEHLCHGFLRLPAVRAEIAAHTGDVPEFDALFLQILLAVHLAL